MPNLAILLPYLVLATGVSLSLCALMVFRAELNRQARRRAEDQQTLLEAVRQLQGGVDEIKRLRIQPAAPAAAMNPAGAANGNDVRVPMNRRAQILRLARQGEPPERISAMLGVPVREVSLVLEVSGRQPAPARVGAD